MKSRVSFDMSSSVSLPVSPKSTSPIRSGESTRMFAGCGSPWKNPWRKIIVIHVSVTRYASRRRWSSVHCSTSMSASCTPSRYSSVSTRDRVYVQYTCGTATCGCPAKFLWKPSAFRAFEPVVELLPDRAGELVDDLVRVDEVERADALLREPCRLVHQREIRLDLLRRVRPLHLDDDATAVRQRRAVHLADRRCGERHLVELDEEPLDRLIELLADRALDIRVRERAHVVLKPAQLGDDVRRHDVRPRREQLPELDERRPELVEHLAQVTAARGALDRAGRRALRPSTA